MPIPSSDLLKTKLELLIQSFNAILYEPDAYGLENLKHHNLAGDDPERYKHWEWPQGVGLYGMWKLYEKTRKPEYLAVLEDYYRTQIERGLPARNVNTTAPMLALSYLAEHTGSAQYMELCAQWAQWVASAMPRTEEGGLQHVVSEQANTGELWDDTLFMTVLFLANMGRILKRADYLEDAAYQFLLHAKYLTDTRTGLWFHGFTFQGRHNFVKALWGRGNCWVTIAIPVFLEILSRPAASAGSLNMLRRFLQAALEQQVKTLAALQEKNGMWHTLLDDPGSYLETSATSGFGYGILKGIHSGLLSETFRPVAEQAVNATVENIGADGVVAQVSYGTPMGRDSRDFYKKIPIRPMPYGQSLALLALMESLNP
ncbi:glycosyl hydrolase [Spirochaetia bacterium]|nr:glycosyl hydrolase [Spirochaetia bacterium]